MRHTKKKKKILGVMKTPESNSSWQAVESHSLLFPKSLLRKHGLDCI